MCILHVLLCCNALQGLPLELVAPRYDLVFRRLSAHPVASPYNIAGLMLDGGHSGGLLTVLGRLIIV
jgi:hypothetical protein